jgi:hypothetical protein
VMLELGLRLLVLVLWSNKLKGVGRCESNLALGVGEEKWLG